MDEPTRGIGEGEGQTGRTQPTSGASSGRSARSKRTGSTDDTGLDRETEIRTREIQAEIADTRAELSETVEAIQEKLRPSNIVAEGTDAVRNAASERVRSMADSATRTAQEFMEGTRQNPMPALMIGAGIVWLIYDRARNGSSYNNYDTYRGSRTAWGTPTGAAYDDWDSGREYDDDTGSYSNARSSDNTDSGLTGAGYNTQSVRRMTRNAQNGLQRMLHENPLLVAAAAVLAGAAIGGALPQTEQENELMGEARDRVVDRGKEAAREAADSVRDVAHAVQDVASQVTRP